MGNSTRAMHHEPINDCEPLNDLASAVRTASKPGDLILISGTDFISRIIQIGTRSVFGHVAVVTGENHVTEAFASPGRRTKHADSVVQRPIEEIVARSIRQLKIVRPRELDVERLIKASTTFATSTIPFPKLGLLHLAWCRVTTPLLYFMPRWMRTKVAATQARLTGDRALTMHCAETATRMYVAAGMAIEFREPVYALHIQSISASDWGSDDETSPRFGVKPGAKERPRLNQSPADAFDFATPADFDRSVSFEPVALFKRRGTSWKRVI